MLLVSCNQTDIEVLISIKYGWNTIAWAKTASGTLSKPAAKSQNFVYSTGVQKSTLENFSD